MHPNRTEQEKALDYAIRIYPYEYEDNTDDYGLSGRAKPIDPDTVIQLADKFLLFLEGDEVK